MSRIGKLPVTLEKGVTASIQGSKLTVKGPKGTLDLEIISGISARIEDGTIYVERASESRTDRANHGLMRALIANMATGVSKGFSKKLEIVGIGYKAEVKGSNLVLSLGYSHPIEFAIPANLKVEVERNFITISGIDKQVVGQAAAVIRRYRKPDSYKGKGIRYVGEKVRIKAGKSAA